jgi:hypothetical protein
VWEFFIEIKTKRIFEGELNGGVLLRRKKQILSRENFLDFRLFGKL